MFFLYLNPAMNYIVGVLCALQRCLLESPSSVGDTLDRSGVTEVLNLLENISLLLLSVLYGDHDTEKGKVAIC